MTYAATWASDAKGQYEELEKAARAAFLSRQKSGKAKASDQEGTFKQVKKALGYLLENPRHPSLNTHEYSSLPHPWKTGEKVFEAYAQNHTPGAYRIFWCYGPDKNKITIIAITPHP